MYACIVHHHHQLLLSSITNAHKMVIKRQYTENRKSGTTHKIKTVDAHDTATDRLCHIACVTK